MTNVSLLKIELERLVKQLHSLNDNIFDMFQVFYDYVSIIEKQPEIKEMLKNEGSKYDKLHSKMLEEYNTKKISKEQMHILHQRNLMTNIWFNYGYFEALKKIMDDPKNDIAMQLPIRPIDLEIPLAPYRKQLHIDDFMVVHIKIMSFLSKLEFSQVGGANDDVRQKGSGGIPSNQWSYNEETKILSIGNERIKISKLRSATKQAMLFEYLISNGPYQQTNYYDISASAFKVDENDYKCTSCLTACRSINDKIRKNTALKIDDFLDFSTGKNGWVKVNSKYISTY